MKIGGVHNNCHRGSNYRRFAPIEINVDPEFAMAIRDLAIKQAKISLARDKFEQCRNLLEGAQDIAEAVEEYRNELVEENEDSDDQE